VDSVEINGIVVVIANGKGISLFTKARIESTSMSGWVWKLPRGTHLPMGLRLINDRPGHYTLCPTFNMPLDEFKGLLAKLALGCHKLHRVKVSNG
jgi:hypothetical protein